MGTKALHVMVVVLMSLAAVSCTGGAPDSDESVPTPGASTSAAAEPTDRLENRLASLTDLEGRPLYIEPESRTRALLEAGSTPPPVEPTYSPTECAPPQEFTPPPESLEGVWGRSNLNDGEYRLEVWIYTAPEEELVEYLIPSDVEVDALCQDFAFSFSGITQNFSYTLRDSPPVAPHAQRYHYTVTQDGSTTRYVTIAAVNGTVATVVTLSTDEPADRAMSDAILRLAQQATQRIDEE
ncbi:hypothetical protein E8P82_01295 [Arthrobacter echini]|uniref:Sensor domain-containing protein n=1 Tax=Arthrobacter echini TaxID=1529066 RepID=A0A4S5EA20_9MICC|nr:hypothetical protein [Arthrobacter echini]THJ68575.1 hypothetical protein E8P82_01295 [Arthrobacter echini]